jgi:hypothetical protein
VVPSSVFTPAQYEITIRAIEYMHSPYQDNLAPIVNLVTGAAPNTVPDAATVTAVEDAITGIIDEVFADPAAVAQVTAVNTNMARLGGRMRVVANQYAAAEMERAQAEVTAAAAQASRRVSRRGGGGRRGDDKPDGIDKKKKKRK